MEQSLAFPNLSPDDVAELRRARSLLEGESLAVRVADVLGRPIERSLGLLPEKAALRIQEATRTALQRALGAALRTLSDGGPRPSADRWHRLATATSGALGGFFGLGGLAVEIPVTTVLMFRSIADIARAEGHDIADPQTHFACLEVFALGGPGRGDDPAETGYFAVRAALAGALADAAAHIARRGMASEGAPALVRAVAAVASRFGILVEEKVALGAIPLVGAVTASAINTAFTHHFQQRARGHFIVRRLEAVHGLATVRRAWDRLEDSP